MQTFREMVNELNSRMGVASNSTKFPTSRLEALIKDAHLWATSLYPFKELTVPKTAVTTAYENYDYPEEYRSDSIWAVYVDGKLYKKKSFASFYQYRINNPTSTKRIFADMNRQFFLGVLLPQAGLPLDVFGQVQATQFSGDDSTSIFSNSNDEGNEAIILRAKGVAKNDANATTEAVGILTKIFSDQKDNDQFNQPVDVPLFNVPDFFGGGVQRIGNFGSFSSSNDNDPDDDI